VNSAPASTALNRGTTWQPGTAPVAVVMISLNEAHNMVDVLENLKGFAQEVFLVDSYSSDETVDIALSYGVHVVQRPFRGFGEQWNFAMRELPITTPWTMKLDPDERLTQQLKQEIAVTIANNDVNGFYVRRRLWFMGVPLHVEQTILRGWRTGKCRFSDVLVNEHPLVEGQLGSLKGHLEHHDSPSLFHWLEKQNKYSSAEAESFHFELNLSDRPRIFGTKLQRRMWLKTNFRRFPFRYTMLTLYNYIFLGAWRSGKVGWIWSRLRTDVHRQIEFKIFELENHRAANHPDKCKN